MNEGLLHQSYRKDLENEEFVYDAAQEAVVQSLDQLYAELLHKHEAASTPFFQKVFRGRTLRESNKPVKGLYIWGSVGTGKTYLVDKFYAMLPFQAKLRMHFHRFMRRVHAELNELQGEKNPLEILGKAWGEQYRVICLDEFFVSDITDAMILSGLLESMFASGVSLVTTSNVVPNQLYKDGLQRARFLPAIDLLVANTLVVNLNASNDFRLRSLEQAEIYHSPLNSQSEKLMKEYFRQLAPDRWEEKGLIELDGRTVTSNYVADDVVWFEFETLCGGPRSQRDYIELAMVYHAILLSNVPILQLHDDDKARRFIHFVDEVYDRGVKLIVSAEASIKCLYQGVNLRFEFERTQSRLIEMQSHEYLAKPHRS